jgi:deoxyhypusine synthase
MGAHPIKVGLGPVIVDLMRRGMIHGLAVNGATMIHDFELAFAGRTSEDVGAHLTDGRFGMARETGEFLNRAAAAAAAEEGLGAAVARAMAEADLPYAHSSIFVAAHRYEVPLTVHVAIGTDIVTAQRSAAQLWQTSANSCAWQPACMREPLSYSARLSSCRRYS